MTPPSTPPASPRFGISPSGVTALARAWRAHAALIDGLDVAALSGLSGLAAPSSRVVAALRTTARPARDATLSISTRLATMADILTSFAGRVVTDDHLAASRLGTLPYR